MLQIHLSGGEPTARKDLEEIVKVAAEVGLYTNLITAGVTLTRDRLAKLAELGLDHVQLSIQDVDRARTPTASPPTRAACAKKIEVAKLGPRARPPPHHQRADPSPEHQERRRA